jgi:hypothetical protein
MGFQPTCKAIDLFVCSSKELRRKAKAYDGGWMELYEGKEFQDTS